jgi:hypothetical protein
MEVLVVISGLTALGAGIAMSLFAWGVVRQHRGRESARVELLSGLAFPNGMPAGDVDLDADEFPSEQSSASAEPLVREEPLFREPVKSDVGSRRTIALAAVCAVTAIVVSTYVAFTGTRSEGAPASQSPATVIAAPKPDPRVELLALDHASTSAGLVVTGRLRNPADGASLHDVVAVVDVFDRSGRVITTARARIARPVLNAGEWSDFSVAATKSGDVARYRVEFHAKELEPVPQVDMRAAASTSRSE